MNLAKYVSWDTLISCAAGTLAALTIGTHYGDWVIGCWAFTGAQYLAYNFITLQRIDTNLQILCLRTELKKSMDEEMRTLQKMLDDVERRDD